MSLPNFSHRPQLIHGLPENAPIGGGKVADLVDRRSKSVSFKKVHLVSHSEHWEPVASSLIAGPVALTICPICAYYATRATHGRRPLRRASAVRCPNLSTKRPTRPRSSSATNHPTLVRLPTPWVTQPGATLSSSLTNCCRSCMQRATQPWLLPSGGGSRSCGSLRVAQLKMIDGVTCPMSRCS